MQFAAVAFWSDCLVNNASLNPPPVLSRPTPVHVKVRDPDMLSLTYSILLIKYDILLGEYKSALIS